MARSCDAIPSLATGTATFMVSSNAFALCQPIPAVHTCEAKPFPEGTSFPVTWTPGPTGTMSYAVVFKDLAVLDRTASTDPLYNRGYHWAMWDIPINTMTLPAGLMGGAASPDIVGARQWSSFNNFAFFGPCPNFNPAMPTAYNDTYAIVVYALPTAKSTVPAPDAVTMKGAVRLMDDVFKAAALATAEYRGTSDAHASVVPDGVLPPTAKPPCPTDASLVPPDCVAGP